MRPLLRTLPSLRQRGATLLAKSPITTAAHPATATPQPPVFLSNNLKSQGPISTTTTANNKAATTIRPTDPGAKMPPGYKADVAALPTFTLPSSISSTSAHDRALGRALVAQWQREGIIQIAMSPTQRKLWADAKSASKAFFARPHAEKAACVDPLSYAGYIASGEEITAGIRDYSEIFTVTKDLGYEDKRVKERWPCHGPCPWPSGVDKNTGLEMKEAIGRYEKSLAQDGEVLLGLVELGLGAEEGALRRLTKDGWHHMRVLR